MDYLITFLFCALFVRAFVKGEVSSKWDFCGCRWDDWKPWSSCTATCGGGYQQRSRNVWIKQKDGCMEFTDCAGSESGWQTQTCGTDCNRGYYSSSPKGCVCENGWIGSCCTYEVSCGAPNSISHGSYSGSQYTYDKQVVYRCDTNYNLTDPSTATRRCTIYGYWSGSVPRCEYAASCNSYPCKNGAYCTNLLSDYRCTCRSGWTGKNCELDIQPPVVANCPSDKHITTSNMTHTLTWTEPTFTDPHGREVTVSKNYQNNTFDFPWGEFTVQYTAVKPFNGLTESCLFKVSVKPFPCTVLKVPANGIMVCNGWNTEYARVCKLLCLANFTYLPGFKASDWYTCGSSGNWFPSAHLSECLPDDITFGTSNGDDKMSFEKCNKEKIGVFYIRSLQASQFNSLCGDHTSLCKATNLNIICN